MATVEFWSSTGRGLFDLDAPACLVGSGSDADLVVDDPTVSRVHLALERAGAVWLVRDLGSRNGTLVNGRRVMLQQRLHHGDEIVAGRTRLVFLDRSATKAPPTEALDELPYLTKAEHETLVELCRPILSGNPFTPPATDKEISERRFVTISATKGHLGRLYDKFGIVEASGEPRGHRRVRLANDAIQRGAIIARDLE